VVPEITALEGFSWSINGHAAKPAPTTAVAPVATYRKSRRVGSGLDEFATKTPRKNRQKDNNRIAMAALRREKARIASRI
jgi:hypothetical protein